MFAEFVSVGLVVGPVSGYVAELWKIYSSGVADGYSLRVTFILLTCNTLRIFYWFGVRFAVELLLQSILMIAVHLVLLGVTLHNGLKRIDSGMIPRAIGSPSALSMQSGSPGPSATTYFVQYAVFSAIGALICIPLCQKSEGMAHFIGAVALGIEAFLLFPQIRLNFERKTVDVSGLLLFTWIGGDATKMLYFVLMQQPFVFIACASIQLLFDAILLLQIFTFGRETLSPKPFSPL